MTASGDRLSKWEQEELSLFISHRYGLDFHQQRRDRLDAAVQMRMEACKVMTAGNYLQLIRQREEEALKLVQLLTVHETYFFREPAQMDVMTRHILPRLIKTGGKYPVFRFLSAGCSNGEEAYSLAMAALKIPGAGAYWDFEVIGVDVDPAVIKTAQDGLYGRYSFRACPELIQSGYFDQMGQDHFAIRECVKEKVRFETLNLFAPVYPEQINNLDIIFYRNVSIYFSQEQRGKIFLRLAGLLNLGGCIFLSCTETLYHQNQQLAVMQNGEVFYYQKQADAASVERRNAGMIITERNPSRAVAAPVAAGQVRKPASKIEKKSSGRSRPSVSPVSREIRNLEHSSDLERALEWGKRKKYGAALGCLDEILAREPFCVKAHTLKANILLNRRDIAAARNACQAALAVDTFCLEAYLLLGMAAKFSNDLEEAAQRFKEALYVQSDCWLAHFYLAEVYQTRGENGFARREYEVAARILEKEDMDNHGLSVFITPFRAEDFIRVCRHNIGKMRA